jgi:tRNA dimethylallyltransferase
MSFEPLLDCWYLTGATASGKTRIGVELARRIGAEILSLDSMALYRGMDIGTAKPTIEEQGGVPHHLIDLVEPHEEFSLARYVETAALIVNEIRERGKTPLFVGGTPLYLKSLLRGMFEGPEAAPDIRERLQKESDANPPSFLHERLKEFDPAAAERLHPNDVRRIIRAIEVFELTGSPISELQREFSQPRRPQEELRVFTLSWERSLLHRRIEQRVDIMFEEGLIDEARRVRERCQSAGFEVSKTAGQAVGYREIFDLLDGKIDREEARNQVVFHTRQLAKRQETWFRSLEECRMIAMDETSDAEQVAQEIEESE